jgi:putative transposase
MGKKIKKDGEQMIEFISIPQAAKLEGLSTRAIEIRIKKNFYETRSVPSKKQQGKTVTIIAVTSLPALAQAKLIKGLKETKIPIQKIQHRVDQKGLGAWYMSLPKNHKGIIDARQAILFNIKEELENVKGKSKTTILKELCKNFEISQDTYYRFKKSYELEGLYGLRNKRYGQVRSKLSADQKNYIVQLIKQNPDRRDARIFEYVNHKFPENPLSRGTINRHISAWKKKNHELYTFLKSPDKWKNNYLISFGSHSEKAKHFLQFVELDSTPADLLCNDGKRYTIIGGIDIFSRKVKCKVSPTSSSMGISALIRSIITDWGIPENFIRDNGKDYTSNHINSVFNSLDVNAITLPPFTPEGKPHIERFFRTLSGSLFEEISGYIGHNVAARKDIESRRSFAQRFMRQGREPIHISMHPEQLQEIIDRWIENVYHHKHHVGINTSPKHKAAQSIDFVRKIESERALDILLLPVGEATVYKKGIRYQTGNYQSPDLAGFIKERVTVRRDLDSTGKLYVFDLEGNYITTAWDASLEGIPEINHQQIRKEQRKRIAKQKAAIETLTEEPMIQLINKREGLNNFSSLTKRQTASTRKIEAATNATLMNEGIKPQRFQSIAEQMNGNRWENENELSSDEDSLDFLEGCEIAGND